MLIKHPQDFCSGLMFIVLGLSFALIAKAKYAMGTTVRLGPGYFPFVLGILLAILGAIVALSALRGEYQKANRVQRFDGAILLLVIGSIALFALLLNHLGLYISIAVLVLFSSLASHEFNLKIALLNTIFLLFFAWVTFIKGLHLVFPVWPLPFDEWDTYAQVMIPAAIVAGLSILFAKLKKRGQPS